MKKRITALALALVMIFALAACGSSAPQQAAGSGAAQPDAGKPAGEKEDAGFLPLEIREFGWAMGGDYLYYALILHNPNAEYAVYLPSYRITARDAAGALLGTEDQTLSIIYPGHDSCHASMAFKAGEEPAQVDVEILPLDEYKIKHVSTLEHPEYEQLTVVNASLRDNKLLGEIENRNDYPIHMAVVSIIFRDADGKLLAGESAYVDDLAEDGLTPFQGSVYAEFATGNYEVYADLWG